MNSESASGSPRKFVFVGRLFHSGPFDGLESSQSAFPRRPESGGFRFRSAPRFPHSSLRKTGRTQATSNSSLSFSLKTPPFRFLAHSVRLRCSVSLRSLCASGPTQIGDRSTPGLSGLETRYRGRRVFPVSPRGGSLDGFPNPPLHSRSCWLGTCAIPNPRRWASRQPGPAPEVKTSWTPQFHSRWPLRSAPFPAGGKDFSFNCRKMPLATKSQFN